MNIHEKIAKYREIPQSGKAASITTTRALLRRKNGCEIITQQECKQAGAMFPDDEGKVEYCGFFYGRMNKIVAFWLYKQSAGDEDRAVCISLSDSAGA